MFERILDAIRAHDTIILHRHTHPDGDALGSQIGLKHLIQDNFPGKTVYAVGDAAGRYGFMEDSVMDIIPDAAYEEALAIVLDTSAVRLISDERYALAQTTARIDHHLFVETIAQIEVIDSTFDSCCSLVTALAEEARLTIDKVAAASLYTGMVTDSGRFRYDSTSSRTFRLASLLMEQSIDLGEIYRNLYACDYEQLYLRSQLVLKMAFTPHRVAYIYTTRAEADAYGVDDFTLSRGMVNVMADIRGVSIWVNFTESEQGVLCELRSDRFNINPVAVKYGGGGHAKASGATLPDRDSALAMLRDLDNIMAEGNE